MEGLLSTGPTPSGFQYMSNFRKADINTQFEAPSWEVKIKTIDKYRALHLCPIYSGV